MRVFVHDWWPWLVLLGLWLAVFVPLGLGLMRSAGRTRPVAPLTGSALVVDSPDAPLTVPAQLLDDSPLYLPRDWYL